MFKSMIAGLCVIAFASTAIVGQAQAQPGYSLGPKAANGPMPSCSSVPQGPRAPMPLCK